MTDIRELADEATVIDGIALRLAIPREDLDDSHQQLVGRAAKNLHATAAFLRTLGSFTKRKKLMKAKAGA